MRLICPECGAVASATAWANDAAVRQVIKTALEMPWAVSSRALPYIALFRPSGNRGLSWDKALRLMTELAALAVETHVQWDGKPARPVSAEIWGQALESITARPPKKLPLKSHGYLTSIAYDLANESDRRNEVARNQAEASGSLRADLAAERAEKPASPEAVSAMMEKWRSKRRRI